MEMNEEERRRRAAARRRRERLKRRRRRAIMILICMFGLVIAAVALLVKVFILDPAEEERNRDKIAPVVMAKNITVLLNASVTPQDMVQEVVEENKYTISFETPPDTSTAGDKTVKILAKDEEGNVGSAQAVLTVYNDTTPPVIQGAEDIVVNMGNNVSYRKNVTVTDDYDQNVELVIDSSKVDLNTLGEYEVIYKATDTAGNIAEKKVALTVIAADAPTEDMVYALCDTVLAEITNDSMSEKEKAEKIYWWVHDGIAYYDDAPKDSWVEGAYRGLNERKGDCYTYMATAKALLTRAGIKNMDIHKIPAKERHYWNLIDIGEGWYHFDTTRRKDGTTFFYWTDEQLMEYSNSHKLSHNYDKSQYPQIQ